MYDKYAYERRLVHFSPALELIHCSRREQGSVASLPNRDLAACSTCRWILHTDTMRRFSILPLLIIPVCRLWKKGFQSWQVEKIMIKFTQIESTVTEKKKSPGEIGKNDLNWFPPRNKSPLYIQTCGCLWQIYCWLHIVIQSDLSSVPKTTHTGILDIKLKLRQSVRLWFADSPMSYCVSAEEKIVMKRSQTADGSFCCI